VLKKSDTYNSTTKQYNYPQTPARVQLSLWPGGLASNAPGTIAWAGGEIDWDSQDIKDNGYYYVTFKEVKIECYDPPSDAQKDGSGSVSYIYDDAAGYESNVVMTDKGTVMKSFLGTGKNMTAALPASKTSSGASPSATDVETIPGLTGAGTGANGLRGEEDSSTTTGSASSSSETAASGSSDFVQQQQGSGADSVRIGGVVALIAAVFVGAVAL
jgi:beta-glucanase (GH16 family)